MALWCMVMAPLALHAQTPGVYVVDSLGDAPAVNPGAGTGQTISGDITLRSAMMAANVDGLASVIEFDPDLTTGGPAEIVVATTLPTVTTTLDIDGPGAELLTVRSTGARIFVFQGAADVALHGLTITGSTAGAIRNADGDLLIRECVIRDNDGAEGALVSGGAIDNRSGGSVEIRDTTLGPNNTAFFGGSIDNFVGTFNQVVAINCTFVGNEAGDAGGAIFTGGVNNTATFINCTFTQNYAAEAGGALYIEGPTGVVSIVNSTVVGNSTDLVAGGMYILESNSTLLINSIFAQNQEAGGNEVSIEGNVDPTSAHNFIGESNFVIGIVDGLNGNQVGPDDAGGSPIDPELLALADNGGPVRTILPAETSPVIDAGTPAIPQQLIDFLVSTDARGNDRLVGSAVDIGAVEVQAVAPPLIGDFNGDGIVNVADVTALARHVAVGDPIVGDADYNGDELVNTDDVRDLASDIANGVFDNP